MRQGFTLVENVVGIAIFLTLALMVYGASVALSRDIRSYQQEATLSSLADEYLEIARNLPYSQVGTLSGNPHGFLPDQPNATSTTWNGVTYQIYYVVNYVDDPADGTAASSSDSAPNDYKQIKLYIKSLATNITTAFATTISPKGLENTANSGSLSIKVFNAVGQPVPNATINITNTAITPNINLTRQSDASGNWIEVGLPDSVNGYHIVVTKGGYSSDQTYPITAGNPNPTKPDETIANGQTTQVSFAIDQTSLLTFNTLDQSCAPLSGIGIEVTGTKLIGTPSVLKFDQSYTSDSNGQVIINPIEWDTYTPVLSTGSANMIYGSSPIQEVSMLPNTAQTFALILGPKTTNSLIVIVKDSATSNPLEGATVDLHTPSGSDLIETTGGSVWSQTSWDDGPGQKDFVDPTGYSADDGGISTSVVPDGVRLASVGANYISAGSLTSSSFDTGTASSSYTTLTWQPSSQDPATSIAFQVATNNDDATWNYVGPDGTNGTYYTVPGTTISTSNNNNRYIRYKVFLSTTDPTKTPVLTSTTVNYVSGCFTPGQAMYAGLSGGAGYSVTISHAGYQPQSVGPQSVNGYEVLPITLSQ
jgi:type II secretory pathway pseudopilin PulG